MKTAELFRDKTVFSLEIFPPKPDADANVIYYTLAQLSDIRPDFISVTYGAGGGKNGSRTVKIASDIINKYGIETTAHLPCIRSTKAEITAILDTLQDEGIENILALRGDITDDTIPAGDFAHASDLIAFIKEKYDFNIIAACYPEVHPESSSADEDMHFLKNKVACGADHLITQMFLDDQHFYRFRDRAQLAGINVPIEAGIMPVTNKRQIQRMVKMCGISFPQKFVRVLDRYGDDPIAMRDAGIAYAVDQITDLIAEGVDGIHLYTMNDPYVARTIYQAVQSMISVSVR